jgi:prepilin signal peptidase PulO-like enzyme (type II secretory pathway)
VLIIFILVGVLIGALLNLLADDLPHRNTPQKPYCHNCQTPYRLVQWVALIGFLTGQYRCQQCNAVIHWRKPAVELVSALTLAYVYLQFGLTLRMALLGLVLECLLLITIIDLEHRLILYITIFPSAAVAFVYGLFGREFDLQTALVRTLIGGAVGFGVFYFFFLLGQLYSRWVAYRRGEPLDEVAFGGGDANLGGVVGLAVGWPGVLFAVVYAIFAGGAVSLIYLIVMALRRRNSLFTPIPYGPFIVFGAVIVLLFLSR